MKNLLFLVLLLHIDLVLAYELQPSHPKSGDAVSIGVLGPRQSCLTTTSDGESHYFEIAEDNHIQLTVVINSKVMCIGPRPVTYYSLGNLPEGSYSLEVFYIYDTASFPPVNQQVYLTNQDGFQVLGAAVAVPVFSWSVLMLLMSLYLTIAFRVLRKLTRIN